MASKATGPAEFLPLLFALTPTAESSLDTLKTSSTPLALTSAELTPFLNDLVSGFEVSTIRDVFTPTLSLFFQQWFGISSTPDIMGPDWRQYLGAIALLLETKPIAAQVSVSDRLILKEDAILEHLGRAGCRCDQNRVAIVAGPTDPPECLSQRIRESPQRERCRHNSRRYGRPTSQTRLSAKSPTLTPTKVTSGILWPPSTCEDCI